MTDETSSTEETPDPTLPDMPPPPADAEPKADTGRKARRSTAKASSASSSSTPKPSGARRGPGRPPKAKRDLTPELEQFYGTIGLALSIAQPDDGAAILENAERCAKSINDLAQQNPKVHALIENMLAASAIGAVIAAHAPIVVRIAYNHGAPIPPIAAAAMGATIREPMPGAPAVGVEGNGASNN